MMNAVLHPTTSVLSRRHMPSWLLLAFAAGAVNAVAFLACQRFVSHVTGTVTRLGLDAGVWTLVFDYAVVLACFIAGAMASVLAIDGRLHRGKRPLHGVPLLVVSAVLVGVAIAGAHGAFGVFGGSVERPSDFLLLSLISFAMGLQNATVATSTGMAVRTTHMTGPATDLGINLATSVFVGGEARRAALRGALLRGGKLLGFVLGATAAVPLARGAGYLAFLAPAAAVLIAVGLSFLPARTAAAADAVPQLAR